MKTLFELLLCNGVEMKTSPIRPYTHTNNENIYIFIQQFYWKLFVGGKLCYFVFFFFNFQIFVFTY